VFLVEEVVQMRLLGVLPSAGSTELRSSHASWDRLGDVYQPPARKAAGGLGHLDVRVAQFGQRQRVAFTSQDRVDNGAALGARQIVDDVMKLQVHLRERLLGVPHLIGGLRDQAARYRVRLRRAHKWSAGRKLPRSSPML
jgi:hypothetical protein